MTWVIFAQIEPLSVGIHSVANIGQLRANQAVVVFGAGPVGLLCMAVAKALGAKRVIAVDIVPYGKNGDASILDSQNISYFRPREHHGHLGTELHGRK